MNFALRMTGRRPPADRIATKLTVIEHYCQYATSSHSQLFRERVECLIEISTGKAKDIERIVSCVAEKIERLGCFEITQPAAAGIRNSQVEILKEGVERLESLLPGAASETARRSKEHKDEEDEAIQKDTLQYEKSLNILKAVSRNRRREKIEVLVHNMMDPDTSPLELSTEDYPTCRHIRRFLQIKKLATSPDLWVRYQRRQELSPEGLLWEWLPTQRPIKEIQERHLEFVDRLAQSHYIIALKYMKKEMKESPVPLDIASMGEPCCKRNCGNLQAHLQSVWPGHFVVRATSIQEGRDVLTDTFDDSLFDSRTNDLFVVLQPL